MKNKTTKRPRWRSANKESVALARGLRRDQTRAEAILWERLRERRLDGLKFRRQHYCVRYILDFYNAEHRLAIELDGGVHEQQAQQDTERTATLNDWRITVLRFKNEEVEADLEGVLTLIAQACKGSER